MGIAGSTFRDSQTGAREGALRQGRFSECSGRESSTLSCCCEHTLVPCPSSPGCLRGAAVPGLGCSRGRHPAPQALRTPSELRPGSAAPARFLREPTDGGHGPWRGTCRRRSAFSAQDAGATSNAAISQGPSSPLARTSLCLEPATGWEPAAVLCTLSPGGSWSPVAEGPSSETGREATTVPKG